MTNIKRALRANISLLEYAEYHGKDESETLITDLMTDLLHLAHSKKIDIDRLLFRIQDHFEAEMEEEKDEQFI